MSRVGRGAELAGWLAGVALGLALAALAGFGWLVRRFDEALRAAWDKEIG